jgi:hypothetical protein
MYKAAAAAAAADAWLMKLHAVQVGCGTNKKMVGWLEEEQEERRERQKSCYVCRPKMALPIKPERERERESKRPIQLRRRFAIHVHILCRQQMQPNEAKIYRNCSSSDNYFSFRVFFVSRCNKTICTIFSAVEKLGFFL